MFSKPTAAPRNSVPEMKMRTDFGEPERRERQIGAFEPQRRDADDRARAAP